MATPPPPPTPGPRWGPTWNPPPFPGYIMEPTNLPEQLERREGMAALLVMGFQPQLQEDGTLRWLNSRGERCRLDHLLDGQRAAHIYQDPAEWAEVLRLRDLVSSQTANGGVEDHTEEVHPQFNA